MFAQFRPALVFMAVITVLTGVIYPLVITAVSQIGMPERANGSIIEQGGKAVGSKLIASLSAIPGISGAGHRRHPRIRTTPPPERLQPGSSSTRR